MVGTNEMGISLSIRCTNAVWKVGDEIPIEFLITNHGANGYEYANRTDESVKALKSLLGDPDERIRSGVKRAINTAYHYRGRWTGRPLKPDGFDQADGK
jgi:hypothetical protein